MKIGILGAGNVAKTLGSALAKKGHQLFIGSRESSAAQLSGWIKETGLTIQAGTVQEAADFGAVIILAINPWTEIQSLLASISSGALSGKPLIDLSNNIVFQNQPGFAFTDRSMGESVQHWAPQAHVVKTLNITPTHLMVNPVAKGINPALMWVCGNDAQAKQTVTGLLNDLGWSEVQDIGNIKSSKLMETIGLISTNVVMGILNAKAGS